MNTELEKLRIAKHHKAKRHHRPVWPWVMGVIVLLGAGAGLAYWHSTASAMMVQTIRVRVIEGPSASSSRVALNATGYVMAAHKIELASKVIGRVAWIGVEMGDKVAANQMLVRLEDDEYKARVAEQQGQLDNAKARLAELVAGSRVEEIGEAQADVEQAQAELDNANITLTRLKGLDVSRTVSRQEVDSAQMTVNSRQAVVDAKKQHYDMVKAGPRKEQIAAQEAIVRQLEGSLAQSALDLENTVIHAPFASTILSRNVEVGEFVTTGFVGDRGAKGYVVSLADLNDLRVELDIDQNNFAKVAAHQPCWIVTDAYPDHKYDGIVDLISPEANRQKATIEVRVKVMSPDDLLKPDMNATVSFLSMAKDDTTQPAAAKEIRIPAATVRDGNVFVLENGRALKRAIITAGPASNGQVDVTKGLIGGEDLIVDPPPTLSDGAAVQTREPAN